MSGFTSFLTALCAACVFIGALGLVCPDGNMAKSVKYILSLVFLVTVISAAGLISKGFKPDISFDTDISLSDGALEAASAKYAYSNALKSAGINFSEITVCTDKSADGGIVISKLIIYSDCPKERILEALAAAAENTEVEIVNE